MIYDSKEKNLFKIFVHHFSKQTWKVIFFLVQNQNITKNVKRPFSET